MQKFKQLAEFNLICIVFLFLACCFNPQTAIDKEAFLVYNIKKFWSGR